MHEEAILPSETNSDTQQLERENFWHWRDEILQVMFWLVSQGFGEAVDVGAFPRFLVTPLEGITPHLHTMIAEGYIVGVDSSQAHEPPADTPASVTSHYPAYKFTPYGRSEARKRYLDDFMPLRHGHDHSSCPPESPCHQEQHPHE